MSGARTLSAGVTLALIAGGCSLFSSFPDVEARSSDGGAGTGGATTSTTSQGGAGGSGGSGGSGGALTCAGATCQNCLGESACPALPSTVTTLVAPALQTPSDGYLSVIDATETVSLKKVRFIGSFRDATSGGLAIDSVTQVSALANTGAGFVLDDTGAPIVAASPCNTVGAGGTSDPAGGATIFAAAASPSDSVVELTAVVGEFQGNYLGFFTDPAQTCVAANAIAAKSGDMAFTPFIFWHDNYGNIAGTVGPDVDGGSAIFTDVAAFQLALTNGAYHGRVVAAGVTQGHTFDQMPAVVGVHHFLLSTNPNHAQYAWVPDLVPCETEVFDDFDTVDASVAIEPGSKTVWHAGTGCTNPTDTPTGFLNVYAMLPSGDFPASPTSERLLGDSAHPLRITKVAVGGGLVAVAGKYEDAPTFAGFTPETGAPGDAFVMAFDATTYTSAKPPVWFRRFDARGADAKILDLQIVGDAVYAAGRSGSELRVGSELACGAPPLEGTRAFVAALSASDGASRWVRVDGSASSSPNPGSPPRRASAPFVFPTSMGLFTAVDTLGDVLLDCEGSPTSATRATSTVRLFTP